MSTPARVNIKAVVAFMNDESTVPIELLRTNVNTIVKHHRDRVRAKLRSINRDFELVDKDDLVAMLNVGNGFPDMQKATPGNIKGAVAFLLFDSGAADEMQLQEIFEADYERLGLL